MSQLSTVLTECAARLAAIPAHQRIGEQNTKANVIAPVLDALGWNTRDFGSVYHEYRRLPVDNPVDYALLVDGRPQLFVEAKGYGENLDDPKWSRQVVAYATAAGIEWVVLTDGAQWRLFNAHAPVPIEDKELRRASLVEDVDDAVELLTFLRPDRIVTGELASLWRARQGDRAAAAVLSATFRGGRLPESLVTELARGAGASDEDTVRDSLRRVRVDWAWSPGGPTLTPVAPAVSPVPAPPLAVPPAAPTSAGTPTPVQPRRPRRSLVGADERAVKLTDLLGSGRVQPGTLTARYYGREWEAELRADGTIVIAGEACTSPSAAGAAVKVLARGPDIPESVRATDGWDFWSAVDTADGRRATLKAIRRRLTQPS
ncbi:hypothetical protein ACI78V_05180 [Geodermatophilus sp. SYSU D00742]